MRGILIAILALLPLAACGPKTINSMLFPTRYGVTTVVDFRDNGRVVRQTVVSRCRVIDQSDSIAMNDLSISVRGEPHWVRRGDGSLWILGSLDPCRWGAEGPGDYREFAPLRPDARTDGEPLVRVLHPSLTYRIDDPAKPGRIDAYQTKALFANGAEGLKIDAQIAPTGGRATKALPAVLPIPVGMEKKKGEPGSGWETRFVGVQAEVFDMSREPCESAGSAQPGPVLVAGGSRCNPERGRSLGSLRPDVAADFSVVSFSIDTLDPAYEGALFQGLAIQRAGAPGDWRFHPDWRPRVCIDGQCLSSEARNDLTVYFPARRQAVRIHDAYYDLPVGKALRWWR